MELPFSKMRVFFSQFEEMFHSKINDFKEKRKHLQKKLKLSSHYIFYLHIIVGLYQYSGQFEVFVIGDSCQVQTGSLQFTISCYQSSKRA